MNIKKFFEYHSGGDGTSEITLLAKMETNNKKRYTELLSKINATFSTKDEIITYVRNLVNKQKNISLYILLDNDLEYNTIFKFDIKDDYYTIQVYGLNDNETDNEVKFQIYDYDSTGSRYENDIYDAIKKG